MNQKLAEALETCIEAMEAGAPMEECLKKYPNLAVQLQGLLATVEKIDSLKGGDITDQQITQSRLKLLSNAYELVKHNGHSIEQSVTKRLLSPFNYVFRSIRRAGPHVGRLATAMVLAIAFIALSGGLLNSSAKSLPGDSLYPVKLAVENIKLRLAPSGVIREEYEINYGQQRVAEVQRLIELGRQQKISFGGVLASIDGDTWMVSGVPVKVGAGTSIQDGTEGSITIPPGTKIEVEGVTNNHGSVEADEILVREHYFLGIVEEIGQRSWKISGTTLYVSNDTRIDTGIKPGDEVTVLVESEDDGMYALSILLPTMPAPGSNNPPPGTANPTQDEASPDDAAEKLELDGEVNAINPDYWIINGEHLFTNANTGIDESINLGDKVSASYFVEHDGSFTAIEIKKSELNTEEKLSEGETPAPAGDQEGQSITTASPTEHEEHEAPTPSPESDGTPEPSVDH